MASKLQNLKKAISAIDAKIGKLNHRKSELLGQASKLLNSDAVSKGERTHPSAVAVKAAAEKKEESTPVRTDASNGRPKGHYYSVTEQSLIRSKQEGRSFRDALIVAGYRAGGFADLAGLDEDELKSIWNQIPISGH